MFLLIIINDYLQKQYHKYNFRATRNIDNKNLLFTIHPVVLIDNIYIIHHQANNMKTFSALLRSPFFAVYLGFCVLVLGAILVIQPGWGFMDDHTNLRMMHEFQKTSFLNNFQQFINAEISTGRFRPIYVLWVLSMYKVFAETPIMIYFLTTLAGMLLLPLWGLLADNVFNDSHRSPFWIWVFPLTFFCFTPFWNIFMYISIQEKFIYFFGTPAILFFLKAYRRNTPLWLIPALLFSLLAMAGKETGIFLLMGAVAYALTDILIFKRNKIVSTITALSGSAAATGYYFFISGLIKGYSSKYAGGMSLLKLGAALTTAPLVIKIIVATAVIGLAGTIITSFMDRSRNDNGYCLFPWLTLCFILILLPWGFPNYMLAPLAMIVIFSAAPALTLTNHWRHGPVVKNAIVIILAFSAAVYIVIPRINKMADKRKIAEEVQLLARMNPEAVFFYPGGMEETYNALQAFSGVTITYLRDNTLPAERLGTKAPAFLLQNDENGTVQATGITADRIVYRNSTWRVTMLRRAAGSQTFHY